MGIGVERDGGWALVGWRMARLDVPSSLSAFEGCAGSYSRGVHSGTDGIEAMSSPSFWPRCLRPGIGKENLDARPMLT